MDAGRDRREGNLVHAGARPAAGLHRRALRRRSGGDARRHRRSSAATRSASTRCSRSSWSSTTRCRSITSAAPTRLQLNAELEYQRNRERYVFLRWGQTAFRNFRVVPPDTGIVHQVNIEYLARVVCRETAGRAQRGLSGHALRHRLAHDDGQRPGRGRLGRRRHRGRGGDARPAELDADSAGARLPADGPAARGRDGHRPRADDHRGAAQEGRRRQVRRVLRPGLAAPDDRRPRDARQHVPGVRRDGRDLSDRRHDARLPAAHGPRRGAGRAGRGVRARRRGCSAPTRRPTRSTPTRSSWIWRRSSRAWPGPRRPQDRVALATAKASFASALPDLQKGIKKAAAPAGGGRGGGRANAAARARRRSSLRPSRAARTRRIRA